MANDDDNNSDDDSASVSSSSSAGSSADQRPGKRRKLPPPAGLQGFLTTDASGNSESHDGRKRRIAHVDGNYATWVYIPVNTEGTAWNARAQYCAEVLKSLNPDKNAQVHVNERVGQGSGLGWHVSLAPLLMLRRHFIDAFLETVRASIAKSDTLTATTMGTLYFEEEVWVFASKDFDRFFSGVVVQESQSAKLRGAAETILDATSKLLSVAPPSAAAMQLHCSLAWTLGDLRPALVETEAECFQSEWGMAWRLDGAACQRAAVTAAAAPSQKAGVLKVKLDHFCAMVGERKTTFPLPRQTPAFGLLGSYAEDDDSDE